MRRNSREQNTYECVDCRTRVEADTHPVSCDRCGGEMRNISKPRGQ
ncbi:MAG: rubrerythrin-like domain-containing protein [Halobacterium sp.]